MCRTHPTVLHQPLKLHSQLDWDLLKSPPLIQKHVHFNDSLTVYENYNPYADECIEQVDIDFFYPKPILPKKVHFNDVIDYREIPSRPNRTDSVNTIVDHKPEKITSFNRIKKLFKSLLIHDPEVYELKKDWVIRSMV
ncbi:hypothetical protein HDV02_006445 [Globomyces sp. JEL0801]|nr:hypothetical protein HDV02_006445 [Globomyces sp. JEL0801]